MEARFSAWIKPFGRTALLKLSMNSRKAVWSIPTSFRRGEYAGMKPRDRLPGRHWVRRIGRERRWDFKFIVPGAGKGWSRKNELASCKISPSFATFW